MSRREAAPHTAPARRRPDRDSIAIPAGGPNTAAGIDKTDTCAGPETTGATNDSTH